MTIAVAHDIICPWCWIGMHQAHRLHREFGVTFDWQAYELMPENLPYSASSPDPEKPADRAPTPSRFQLALAASSVPKPTGVRPDEPRSHNVLESLEFAKEVGTHDAWMARLYTAYWMVGENVNDLDVMRKLAEGQFKDVARMIQAVENREFDDRIIKFDDDAYAAGIYNVPTFIINGEKFAEQPYVVLADAVRAAL